MALSTNFKQFLALFAKQCNPIFPKSNNVVSKELWTTVPQSLTEEAKSRSDLLTKWGFNVWVDFPHSGNGGTVSPNGEVDIFWKNGKIDEHALSGEIGDINIINEYSISYVGDYISIKL